MKRGLALGTSGCLLAGAALLGAAPAVAAGGNGSVPFSDPNQNGLITLCNAAGQRITSGSIDTMPFVVKAVSSAPAPHGYESGLATLYAYQPIQYVDPGNWSDDQLSGSTYFSNPAHPGAALTPSDEPLVAFTTGYPLHWDGLLQLRLLYTAPNTQPYPGAYPAAVLRVTGRTWTVVQGGDTPCNATRTKSLETIALKKRQYAPRNQPTAATEGSTGARTSPGAGAAATDGTPAAAADSAGHPSSAVFGTGARRWVAGAVLAVLVLLGVAAAAVYRRRRTPPVDA
jgi:hypothetical protein